MLDKRPPARKIPAPCRAVRGGVSRFTPAIRRRRQNVGPNRRTGNDALLGGGGTDKIFGSDGNDTLLGGAGKDDLFGQGGIDTLSGAGGNDRLFGGSAADICNGGNGTDAAAQSEEDTYDSVETMLTVA